MIQRNLQRFFFKILFSCSRHVYRRAVSKGLFTKEEWRNIAMMQMYSMINSTKSNTLGSIFCDLFKTGSNK